MLKTIKFLTLTAGLLLGFIVNPVATTETFAMQYKNISAREAYEMMASGTKLRIIDVRTPEEFAQGRVPKAINVPLDKIEAGQIPFVMADKNATYLLYCRSGRRSGIAAGILSANGWKNVYNFGGILDWEYDVER